MKKIGVTILCSALLFSAGVLCAQVTLPAPSGFVNDYAGIISSSEEGRIENILGQIERKTSAEVSVVTVKTTKPLTIEQYAVDLFAKWGIGKKGKDNGILLLVAVDDRKVRIEVGYGLEGAVTDLESKLIIDNHIVPFFKEKQYGKGVYAAVIMLSDLLAKEYEVKLDLNDQETKYVARAAKRASPLNAIFTLIFFIMIFGFRFGPMFFLMSSPRIGYWGGGSGGSYGGGGGGFGGFGGGFSGGGGASGGW